MRRDHRIPAIVFLACTLAIVMHHAVVAHEADGHPARIHEGTCATTGAAADRLTGVGATVSLDGTPIPAPAAVGSEAVVPIDASTTTIEEPLAHLTEEPHAILVYKSDEAMDQTIACGTIGGLLTGENTLIMWLAPVNGADATGVALLHDEGGTATTVTIYLAEGLSDAGATDGHDHETPEATPSG
jgi:hypothetical protein